jgi:hypothetical protein
MTLTVRHGDETVLAQLSGPQYKYQVGYVPSVRACSLSLYLVVSMSIPYPRMRVDLPSYEGNIILGSKMLIKSLLQCFYHYFLLFILVFPMYITTMPSFFGGERG